MKTILSQWYKRASFFFFFLLLHTIPLNGCAITHLSFSDGHLGCLKCFDVPLKFFIDIAKLPFQEILCLYFQQGFPGSSAMKNLPAMQETRV